MAAAVAASRTTNPLLLVLLIAVVGWVAAERREPSSQSILAAFIGIALAVVLFRVLLMALLGNGVVGPTVIVDFAHTPDALENVLRTMQSMKGSGKVISVFGCGGDRDKTKRPIIAKIGMI